MCLWQPLFPEVDYVCKLHHLTAVECHLTGMVDDAVATDNPVTVFLKDDADTELAPQLLQKPQQLLLFRLSESLARSIRQPGDVTLQLAIRLHQFLPVLRTF